VFDVPMLPLCGDIKLDFHEKDSFGSDRLLCFWFNTLFVGSNNIMDLKKSELDKAAKDKNCKIFKENFKIELVFDSVDSESKVYTKGLDIPPPSPRISDKSPSFVSDKDKELTSTDEEDEVEAENSSDGAERNRDPIEVSEFLLKQLIEIRLLYEKLSDADFVQRGEFALFEQSLNDLSEISYAKLTTPQHKVAFWINLFNMMLMYATFKRYKYLQTLKDRLQYFSTFSLNIGGLQFSVLDIQFGILRGSLDVPDFLADKMYSDYVRKFTKEDPRNEHILQVKDPRILFALSEGTPTSPAVHIYHPMKIYEEIEEATRNFIYNQSEIKK